MKKILNTELTKKLMSGNKAVSEAVKLCRVGVISAYPITPQTTVVEYLAEAVDGGVLKAKYIKVDSEASAMAAAIGAEQAGARSFTASSSQGILHMMENIAWAAYGRCPLVLANADRAICHPWGLWSDTNASMLLKDLGLITFYCEDAQDVLDTTIIAYRLSEELLIPSLVSYDGFRCSHTDEIILVPSQKIIDNFLPEFKSPFKLDPENVFSWGNLATSDHYFDMRGKHHIDILKALEKAEEFAKEYEKITGLKRSMLIENVNTEKAKTVFVATGSKVGPIKEVAQKNPDIGLVKVKMFSPFPSEKILEFTKNAEKIIVIDDNLAPGRGGSIWRELRSEFYGKTNKPLIGYVYGLNGQDFKPEIINAIHDDSQKRTDFSKPILWGEKIDVREKIATPKKKNITTLPMSTKLSPGHTACAGCGAVLSMRMTLEALGDNVVVVCPACCWTILQGANGQSTTPNTPVLHTAFGNAAATASGLKAGYDILGREDITVIVWGGDGSTYDIGFGALSGAAARNENFIYFCYNNEAYMNTGVQNSTATPRKTITTTTPYAKKENSKNMPLLMAEHNIPYVATATISYDRDLKEKVKKAKTITGFSYIEILSPCPPGWKSSSENTITLSRLAVQTGIYPLYEIENGVLSKLQPGNPNKLKPVEEYFKAQKRFASMKEEDFRAYDEQVQKYLQKLIAMK